VAPPFLTQGMSAAMLDLLESCYEDEAERPADAAFLAKELGTLLKPAARPDPIDDPPPPPQKDVVNSIGMKLKLIPAGEFQMGSTEYDNEKPRHLVTIGRPFYLGVYPVTQREYMQMIKKNPSNFSGNERLPVESVSWFDAVAFCNELSRKEGLKPFFTINGQSVEVPDWNGPGYRLTTEAEWEYACRAGTTTRFSSGDDEKYWASMHGTTKTRASKPIPWARKSRTHSACSTCTATSGSGAGIGLMQAITITNQNMLIQKARKPARPASFGAAPGTTSRSAPAPPTATGARRLSATSSLGFASPGLTTDLL